MFETIAQGLEIYKKELAEYKAWSDQLKEAYGEEAMKNWFAILGTSDYKKLSAWNARITGMEHALGLTKEEVANLCREAGIQTPEEDSIQKIKLGVPIHYLASNERLAEWVSAQLAMRHHQIPGPTVTVVDWKEITRPRDVPEPSSPGCFGSAPDKWVEIRYRERVANAAVTDSAIREVLSADHRWLPTSRQ